MRLPGHTQNLLNSYGVINHDTWGHLLHGTEIVHISPRSEVNPCPYKAVKWPKEEITIALKKQL